MAGASRVLGTCRALQSDHLPPSSSVPSRPSLNFPCTYGGEKKRIFPANCRGRRMESTVVVLPEKQQKACEEEEGLGFMTSLPTSLAAHVAKAALTLFTTSQPPTANICWTVLQAEMLIERGVVGCRYFTLIAVAGSLIGSILCFVEGCFVVLEAFFQNFHAISQKVDQGRIIHLLIEAIDMFLVGTALLTFGMGLYVMFAGPNNTKQSRGWPVVAESNSFGLFNLKRLAKSMNMNSISEAKSKIGHAVVLILQAGVVDKCKNVPLTSCLDLACFAGAVLISSASVFLLSKLTVRHKENAFI